MLLGFCGENKGNKIRLKPKRGLQPNFYPAKKLLADSNKNFSAVTLFIINFVSKI